MHALRRLFSLRFRHGFIPVGIVFLLRGITLSHAHEPAASIASDRPGFGDGAWVLAPGVWQMEVGGRMSESGAMRAGEGSALLRHGLANVELRVYLPAPLTIDEDKDSWSDAQWTDLGVGVKLPMGSTAAWDWSVVAAATLPTGSSSVTADAVTGFATLVGETKLGDDIGFTLNAGAAASAKSSDASTLSVIPTLSMVISDRMSVYGGYAGFYGSGDDQHWVEAGIATAASRHFQWDINSAYDTDSGDWFFGIGFSRRWLP